MSGGRGEKVALSNVFPLGQRPEEWSWAGGSAWVWSRPPQAGQGFQKGSHHSDFPRQRGNMEAVEPRLSFCSGGQGGSPSPPPGHWPSPSRAATPALFVRPQEPGHFGAQQFDEGPWEHLLGLLGCVLEVVLGMGQHVEESLD